MTNPRSKIKIESYQEILGIPDVEELINIKIPKRSTRTDLIKKRAKNIYEYVILKELEGLASKRIKEKSIITGLAMLWLFIGKYGNTPYCAVFAVPLVVITLIIGLWII